MCVCVFGLASGRGKIMGKGCGDALGLKVGKYVKIVMVVVVLTEGCGRHRRKG